MLDKQIVVYLIESDKNKLIIQHITTQKNLKVIMVRIRQSENSSIYIKYQKMQTIPVTEKQTSENIFGG